MIHCIVGIDGAWSISSASYGLYSSRDGDSVWDSPFSIEDPDRAHIDDSEQGKSDKGFALAELILNDRPWSRRLYSWTISSSELLSLPSPVKEDDDEDA